MKVRNNKTTISLSLLSLACVIIYIINPSNTATWDPRGRLLGFMTYHIPSNSMNPTLMRGDYIFTSTFAYLSSAPARGDIIVFRYPPDTQHNYIKRVIAIAGDMVELKNGSLYINNQKQTEDYLMPKGSSTNSQSLYHSTKAITVPQGSLYVLGDNRDQSSDSRVWGFVPSDYVIGKANYIWLSSESERVGSIN